MGAFDPIRRHFVEPSLRRRWLLAAFVLGLSAFPLVGTLGYENSVALTAPMSVLGVFVGVDAARRCRIPTLDAITRGAVSDLLGLATVAVGLLLIAQLWYPSCDPIGGLLYFVVGPLLSAGLGATSGIAAATLFFKRPSPRWRMVFVGLVPLGFCLLVGLLRLYFDPVVYALDPFWGYFAGPIYDEAIALDRRYLLFRLYNLLLAGATLAAVRLWGEEALTNALRPTSSHRVILSTRARLMARPWAATALALCLTLGAALGLQPTRFGFHSTVEGIAEVLSGTRTSDHFVVHYAPTSKTAREIDVVTAELEFAYHRLSTAIGQAPASRIEVFIFPSAELKRQLIGAGRTEVAPPWRLQLYLNHQPFPARVMPHELAHAFESTIGDSLFGVSGRLDRSGVRLNLALVEGFAVAMAPRPRDGLDLHDTAAILDRLELRPELGQLMGVGFWGQSSRPAYTAAGSFCLWLAETRGVKALADLYGSAGDFDRTYGENLSALEGEWLTFLRTRELRPHDVEALRQLFERRSIFQRPCAHRAADLAAEANAARARGDLQESLEALGTLCMIEPDRPEHQIGRANVLAQANDLAAATQVLQTALRSRGTTSTLKVLTHERLGDVALVRGALAEAARHYQDALAGSTLEAQARNLQVKLLAASDPALSPYLRDYFLLFVSPALRPTLSLRRLYAARRLAELPAHAPLGEYLTGLQLLGIEDPQGAAAHLERSLAPAPGALPLHSPELLRSARLHLVNALVQIRRYDRAEQVLDLLLADPEIGNGHRVTFAEWRARIEFFRGALPAPLGPSLPKLPSPQVEAATPTAENLEPEGRSSESAAEADTDADTDASTDGDAEADRDATAIDASSPATPSR